MQEYRNIYDKLNSHNLPIDESYWDEMEQRLQNNCKKVTPLYIWLTSAGVAASLALLLILSIFTKNSENFNAQIEQKPNSYVIENEIVGTQITQIDKIFTDFNVEKKLPQIAPKFTDENNNTQHIEQELYAVNEPYIINETNILNTKTDIIIDGETITSDITNTEKDTIKKQNNLKPEYDFFIPNEPEKRKIKKSNQLALGLGSGVANVGSNPNLSNKVADVRDPYGSNSFTAYNKQSIDDIYSLFHEVSHYPPLSIGLLFRRNFNNNWGMEGGLTYTFLQSKFKDDNEWYHKDATLKMYYIGFPLNIIVYIINKPAWNFYFSPGLMMEKGIGYKYVQHEYYKYDQWHQASHNFDLQDKIPKVQWSANASFGIGYKVSPGFVLYFEPRILYYLKNNQPISARTEMPLLVGINAGIRFEFN